MNPISNVEPPTRMVAPDADPAFRADVLRGLDLRPRAIPARWFYDRRGSELFEAITLTPEYYPTRTERSLLASAAPKIARLVGPGRAVVEFGSGSSTKTPLLLSAIAPAGYAPIDISGAFLRDSAAALARLFPSLPIFPIEADFTYPVDLPPVAASVPRLGFFPGSTIGNLVAPAAVDLLRTLAATLGEGAMLLIGMDRIKSLDVLIPAYDDAAGVTAAFNLNLLRRMNRELQGTIPVDDFRHQVRWNEEESRIEMHLRAERDMRFSVAGQTFSMTDGETIHTENSIKYGSRDASLLLRAGGWTPIDSWTDPQDYFSLILARAEVARSAP